MTVQFDDFILDEPSYMKAPPACCPECGNADCQCEAIEAEERDALKCDICGEAIELNSWHMVIEGDTLCSHNCIEAFARCKAYEASRLRQEVADLGDRINRMIDRIREIPIHHAQIGAKG